MGLYRVFFFFNPCRCCSAAEFVFTGLNQWVLFLRTSGFSLSNCPAELLWDWNCHGEVLLGTQVWPKWLLNVSTLCVSPCHNSTDSHRRRARTHNTQFTFKNTAGGNRPCAASRVWRHHLTLSCEYSSQWVGMWVLFQTDASAENKAGKTPARETNEASAPCLAVCELQTVLPLILWAHQYPTMNGRTQHSLLSHTHTCT